MPDDLKKKHLKLKAKQLKERDVYATVDREEEQHYEKLKIENLFQYVNFIPSGKHYFYFIKKGKYFCLSDKYAVRKFKNTNLFMNEITVARREWVISEVKQRGQNGNENENKFEKAKSVFRLFKEDNDESLRRMFELDY